MVILEPVFLPFSYHNLPICKGENPSTSPAPLLTSDPARINNRAIVVATPKSSFLLQAICKGVLKYLSRMVSGFSPGKASNNCLTWFFG